MMMMVMMMKMMVMTNAKNQLPSHAVACVLPNVMMIIVYVCANSVYR